jgi:sporulation protein YlmC with PRC-barrel domain
MSYLDRDPNGIYRNSDDSAGPGPRLMGVDTLMGEDVYNCQGDDLGDIKEFMIDMQSGQIAYAVLSFGGILGIGNKLFAVPWQALELDTANKRFILDFSKERLEDAPGFDQDHWPDMASAEFGSQIHGFYRTQQNMPGQLTPSGSIMGQGTRNVQSGSTAGQSMSGQSSSLNQGGSLDLGSGHSSLTDENNVGGLSNQNSSIDSNNKP